MVMNKFEDYPINKQSEHLFLALILMGYTHYEGPASLTLNNYKYYILRPNKDSLYRIFIHKYKAKFHTSPFPNGISRIKVTDITNKTLVKITKSMKL